MELKKLLVAFFFVSFLCSVKAEMIKPAENLSAYDVIKIQLDALKNNDVNDTGIKQTWLFAHPYNKKVTGPYERFRIMIYGQQYKHLLNHSNHKIKLVSNSPITENHCLLMLRFEARLPYYMFDEMCDWIEEKHATLQLKRDNI